MDVFLSSWSFVLPALAIFTIVVFIHELGHYSVARMVGVRVDVFSIGFGPQLASVTDRAGTRWKFSLIPLGGYVKFHGDANAASTAADPSAADDDGAFHGKALWRRAAIVSAGPAANFILAIVIFAGLFMTAGEVVRPAVVGAVSPDSPAAAAGFAPGDRVVQVNDWRVSDFQDLVRIVSLRPESLLDIAVMRDGQRIVLDVVPERVSVTDALGNTSDVGRLGISSSDVVEVVRFGPVDATGRAVVRTWQQVNTILVFIGQMITGDRSTEGLAGPLGIARMSGEVAQFGLLASLAFTAALSINLGLLNLFPVPVLDGGHLLYYAIEWLRGRPLGQRAQEIGAMIGLSMVLLLLVLGTFNDVMRFSFVRSLVGQ
ncbi:MAG: RIP metalloprotease RseP [Alphaproteobacteria bacterium]